MAKTPAERYDTPKPWPTICALARRFADPRPAPTLAERGEVDAPPSSRRHRRRAALLLATACLLVSTILIAGKHEQLLHVLLDRNQALADLSEAKASSMRR